MRNRRYLVVSPIRDEAAYLMGHARTVLAQTEQPTHWVLVDDGSQDETGDLADRLATEFDWISVVHRPRRTTRVLGSGVVRAFNAGLETQDLDDFDFVCKLDADVLLPPTYYATLMDRMAADPRLATTSGRPMAEVKGHLVPERGSAEMSEGMAKVYRVTAFKDIGGLVPELMWDGIDSHEARSHGWRSCTVDSPRTNFQHLRTQGSSDRGVLRGRRRHGHGQWFMGTDPLFMLASATLRLRDEPRLLGSVHMLAGYAAAALRRVPRYGDPSFGPQLRRFQRESIVLGKRRATQRWEARRATFWPGRIPAPATAYLVSQYPTLSHTFIAHEISALRRRGWHIRPYSARNPETTGERPTVLQSASPARVLGLAASYAARAPMGFLSVVAEAVAPAPKRHPRGVGFGYLAQALVLLSDMDKERLTHVHVHFANNASEIARLACLLDQHRGERYRGLTWSVTIHGLWMFGATNDPETDTWPHLNARRWGDLATRLRSAQQIVVISDQGARAIRALLGPQADRVSVIHMGIDPMKFTPPSDREGDGGKILYVGRFAREKSLDLLLDAVAMTPDAHLTMVGSGPEEQRLRARAEQADLRGRVTWTGPVSQDQLPAIYRAADIFAMSSRNEGIPVVLMEAMACGLPVVAPDVGGIPEIVQHRRTGILTRPADSTSLGDALRVLLKDPMLRAALGEQGRQRVCAEFDKDRNAAELDTLLRRFVRYDTTVVTRPPVRRTAAS